MPLPVSYFGKVENKRALEGYLCDLHQSSSNEAIAIASTGPSTQGP
ncbi:hypothetical protein H6G32_11960 [Cylindrospermum sp. FACHB-282]|nr:hypothetical protein [Cylindrospermum sp. FACHB-282]